MANKHRGEIAVQLDKKRKLKFTTHALVELEDALGMPFSKLDGDTMGIGSVCKMVWAGLLHENADLSLREAQDMMDHGTFADISEKVMEAFALAFPEPEPQKKGPQLVNGAGQN